MKRTIVGALVGAVLTAGLVALALWTGWISIAGGDASVGAGSMATAEHQMAGGGTGTEQTGPDREDQTGMQEGDAGEHAGHDMSAASGGGSGEMDSEGQGEAMPAGAVMISPERQQLIGIRTAEVRRGELSKEIRTVGRVEYDETRVSHIHTKVSGWIQRLYVDFTGKLVEKGQPLLSIYSPELVSTQEEYLLALRGKKALENSGFEEVSRSSASLLEATRRRLRLWDVTDEQIAALEERGEPQTYMDIYSPIRGYVIHKGAYEGKFVGPDAELYTIADLSVVWVIADVYESELPLVREGMPVGVSLSYYPGEEFRGRIDYVYPYLTAESRTARVRLVLRNPGGRLKPDMYSNVRIRTDQGEGLLIPEDAIIDSGTRQVAFKVLPGGHFLPTEVEIGNRYGDEIQVLAGLEAGDEIVSGASFLVDSESKLRSALRGMGGGHQHH